MTLADDRIDAARGLAAFDTALEAEFDSLARLASRACATPMAALTLADGGRSRIRSSVGCPPTAETLRRMDIRDETVGGALLEIRDSAVERPGDVQLGSWNATVICFSASAPIRLTSGRRVGAICVLDTVSRTLDPAQRDALRCLALAAGRSFEAHCAIEAERGVAASLAAALLDLDRCRLQLHRFEATPAMLHSIDANGRLIMVSDMWLSKLGYGRHEVIGRASADFLTLDSREAARHLLSPQSFREGFCKNVACQMVARSGRIIDVLMSVVLDVGDPATSPHSLTHVEDVTARLSTERALKHSEANYRRLAEATNDVIVEVDMALRCRYASPACRTVLGYEPDEMSTLRPSDHIHPDDGARVRAVFGRVVSGDMPGDRTMVTYRTRHKLGHWIWVEVGLNLVRTVETGSPRHMICALRDISERRRVAEELEAARAAAERAARTKAEFLANMSHEIRTPLTGLLGVHDLLANEPDLAPHHKRHLALARDAGRSLMAVINDVLDYSRIEAGQLTVETVPFELEALVGACHDFVRQDATDKGLELVVEAPRGVNLLGDPMRLRQVLLNLVANAVKFTTSGSVTIQAIHEADGGRLHLLVSDTGIGISADQLATIFERFRQADGSTSRRFGGTGLGLSICKHLVEAMGGSITVSSSPGKGSRFHIDLPAALAEALETSVSEGVIKAMVPRRVLLAEDNRLNRLVISEMLIKAGHRLTTVENGAEAVARIRDDEPYDVVLMDVQMPVLDGYAASRLIRAAEAQTGKRLLIVGLTANASVEDLDNCIAAGMDMHVPKPVDWKVLLAKLDALDTAEITGGVPSAGSPATVLDQDSLAQLARIIGPERMASMLRNFMAELEGQIDKLEQMPEEQVLSCAHTWISMAGHFGFVELQRQATDLQTAARAGQGIAQVAELRDAAERALLAAKASRLALAA